MVPFQVFTLESEKLHFLNITILQCSICSVGRSNNWLPTGCFETLGPVRMTLSVPRSPDRLNKLPLEENLMGVVTLSTDSYLPPIFFSRFRHGSTKGCQCRCIASDLSKTLQYSL